MKSNSKGRTGLFADYVVHPAGAGIGSVPVPQRRTVWRLADQNEVWGAADRLDPVIFQKPGEPVRRPMDQFFRDE